MTPKDWDKIEKLLGPMADQETVEAVKTLVEGIETNLKGSLTAKVVKSVQRGTISIDKDSTVGTVTLAQAVDLSKASLNFLGYYATGYASSASSANRVGDLPPMLTLNDATTITAKKRNAYNETSVVVSYEVIDFY